ncbi:MAG: PAS domain S-box protein [Desulfohalobiaceae bacterium]|nr:PAS domain S-box protein [Desulfohalobiaceae bacterium]
MANILKGAKVAFVGGGELCRQIIDLILNFDFSGKKPRIVGVADHDPQAEGMQLARSAGIFTTSDYQELFKVKDLEVLIDLAKDDQLAEEIDKRRPRGVRFLNHYEFFSLWDLLQIEGEKEKILDQLEENVGSYQNIRGLFEEFSNHLEGIVIRSAHYSLDIARELEESEKTMAQIIQGSTIPTFVINKDHVITHWNRALENLTGFPAAEMVGTKRQSIPFWEKERPTMADVILDQYEEGELWQYYGEKWKKSALIDDAYEAEVFFPNLGQSGLWCFFTAAPIKAHDGSLIGAIETLWDRTEEKRAEQQREEYTNELAALCSLYTTLSAPLPLHERLQATLKDIQRLWVTESACLFLKGENGGYQLEHYLGRKELCQTGDSLDSQERLLQVLNEGDVLINNRLFSEGAGEFAFLAEKGLGSVVYVPLKSRFSECIGVLRLGSKEPDYFVQEKKNILELLGNRIGVTVENFMLQEQYIKSEEKYRSLFNNDPNPIFILDSKSFEILDCNKRVREHYGYLKEDLSGVSFLRLSSGEDQELIQGLKGLSPEQSVLFSKKRHYRKNGQAFYVNINVSRAKYGELDVLIASTTDITESVEKDAQLIQASKMTTLGTMVAGMAHEISQPLNVIQVCSDFFAKMLKQGQKIGDEDLWAISQDISENVQRAAGIIKHMRDFSRQSEVVKSEININEPIRDVFKILGHQLKVHGVGLELDLDPDIPHILAEHNRLEQVFVNLVNNALDAMDEKKTREERGQREKVLTITSFMEKNEVVVRVSDTGIGMPKEIVDKIFEPFFTTKEVGRGTGLGVSISYGIVQDYQGTIEVDSEPGKGTTFELRFPALD